MAAEAYARVNNRIAAVCVTTGPGGTNALTGVLGGWLDSIPMLVVSGQVRYDTTARYMQQFTNGLPIRAVGDQEFDITKAAASMCKYAVMLEKPEDIRYILERAYHLATTGRRGPSWVDIPVDFQGLVIETEHLRGYHPAEENAERRTPIEEYTIEEVLERIKHAKRPVFYAGNGIRLSGGYEEFRRFVEQMQLPVVTGWDSIDLIEDTHPLYVGRGGIMGDRAGNFAVQNADLILAVGNRLSIRQVGYNWKSWAREAYVIMVDIDPAELKKTTLHVELPICADACEFLAAMNRKEAELCREEEKKVMEQEKVLKKQMAWRSPVCGMETKVSCDDREAVERGWKIRKCLCFCQIFKQQSAGKQYDSCIEWKRLRRRKP